MTRDEIMALTAGRDADEAVAEALFAWLPGRSVYPPHYTTSCNAAALLALQGGAK